MGDYLKFSKTQILLRTQRCKMTSIIVIGIFRKNPGALEMSLED